MEGMEGIHLFDYLVIIGYFVLVVSVGYYFMRYIFKIKDYFAAGGAIPWWMAGTSYWMCSFSALLFVMYSELAYNYGFLAITLQLVSIPAFLLSGYIFAPRWRRARVITPLGFMERRYNRPVNQVFVWTGLPIRLVDNCIKIFSLAILMKVAIGAEWFTLTRCMIIVGIIMILYTYMGGQWAVIINDFVQAIILMVAVTALFILTVKHSGGVFALVDKLPTGHMKIMQHPYDWPFILVWAGMLQFITGSTVWSRVQKYNTVRSEGDARKMVYLVCVLMLVKSFLFFWPAIMARVIFPDLEDPKYTYAVMSLKFLPIGMMGFMLAAMFSATMSTLGGEYNVLSGVLANDFYKKIINPQASEKRVIAVGRINTLIIGLITLLAAIGVQYMRELNLFDIMVRAFLAWGPAISMPLLAGLCLPWFNARGAMWGVIAGMISGTLLVTLNIILVGVYSEQMAVNPTVEYWLRTGWNTFSIITNILVTGLGMWLGTRSRPRSVDEQVRVNAFFDDMKVPFEIEERQAKEEGPSPFFVLGITIGILGFILVAISFALLALNKSGFAVDFVAGALMAVFGLWLYVRSRK